MGPHPGCLRVRPDLTLYTATSVHRISQSAAYAQPGAHESSQARCPMATVATFHKNSNNAGVLEDITAPWLSGSPAYVRVYREV